MTTAIQLSPEAVRRLDLLASQTGRSKAFYLRELVVRGLEELEDYYLAADVLVRLRNGEEDVFSAAEVRESLGLAG